MRIQWNSMLEFLFIRSLWIQPFDHVQPLLSPFNVGVWPKACAYAILCSQSSVTLWPMWPIALQSLLAKALCTFTFAIYAEEQSFLPPGLLLFLSAIKSKTTACALFNLRSLALQRSDVCRVFLHACFFQCSELSWIFHIPISCRICLARSFNANFSSKSAKSVMVPSMIPRIWDVTCVGETWKEMWRVVLLSEQVRVVLFSSEKWSLIIYLMFKH